MHEFSDFIQWFFYAVLSGSVLSLVKVLYDIKDSINKLSQEMAVGFTEINYLKSGQRSHEKRISQLEKNHG